MVEKDKQNVFVTALNIDGLQDRYPKETPIKLKFANDFLKQQASEICDIWFNFVRNLRTDISHSKWRYGLDFGRGNNWALLLLEPVTLNKSVPKTKVFIAINGKGAYSIPTTGVLDRLIAERDSQSHVSEELIDKEGIINNELNILGSEGKTTYSFHVNEEPPTVEIIKCAIIKSKEMVNSIDNMPEMQLAKKTKEHLKTLLRIF